MEAHYCWRSKTPCIKFSALNRGQPFCYRVFFPDHSTDGSFCCYMIFSGMGSSVAVKGARHLRLNSDSTTSELCDVRCQWGASIQQRVYTPSQGCRGLNLERRGSLMMRSVSPVNGFQW
ncbi:uncharacterized protein LOC144238423 isoform X2 [Crocuta crocuta]